MWPLIDELTAEHGIVTSLLVPGYRERDLTACATAASTCTARCRACDG